MAVFAYQSVDSLGKRVSGRLEAVNLIDLELRLKRIGLDLINAELAADTRRALFGSNRITRRDLITFCFHLEQMTGSGLPLLEGLTELRDSMDSQRFREVIGSMIEAIEGGKTLSEALADHPAVFDRIFVSLTRAGESTGRLTEVLQRIADSLKWQDELAAHTKKIVMYPTFVGVVVFAAVAFLMVVLVPQLGSFLKNMGQEMPLQTRALVAVSAFIRDYWYLILGLPILALLGIVIGVRTFPNFAFAFDRHKLAIPYVGPILHKIILSRFASTFAMMYSAGITVLDALKISEEVAGNLAVADALARAGALISEGQNITVAFQSVGLFPPLVLRMLKVGESTGGLDQSLLNVSYFYNREVRESIERVQSLIEPTLTVILGAIIGWVLLAVLGPIYDAIGKLKI
ncbi:MAG: type II secretion system F family protein [Burkholderiales bacterium]|nr:type II secretion system F family protein [Burkholderiales bacterium]